MKLEASERFSGTLDLIVNTGAIFDLNAFTENLGPVELFGGTSATAPVIRPKFSRDQAMTSRAEP